MNRRHKTKNYSAEPSLRELPCGWRQQSYETSAPYAPISKQQLRGFMPLLLPASIQFTPFIALIHYYYTQFRICCQWKLLRSRKSVLLW